MEPKLPDTERAQTWPLPPIGSKARDIMIASLVEKLSLSMPAAVKELAATVSFTPDAKSFLPTPLRMSEASSALWACTGLFAHVICQDRYEVDKPKRIVVDVYSATLMLCSVFLFEINGKPFLASDTARKAMYLDRGQMRETYRGNISNMYKTADGKFFHLHGSLDATPSLDMLGLPRHRPDLQGNEHIETIKDIYRAAVGARDSVSLDAEANGRWRQPGCICYTVEEYAATAHGKKNLQEPLYNVDKVHEQLPPASWPENSVSVRPLAGIKVLDLTKVIAGPTITRVLAMMGADVLRISSNDQPEALVFITDGQVGKRDAHLNLKTPEGRARLDQLLEEADVVVNSYRPGALEKLGFGSAWAHEVARRRGRGIVYCSENCYGWQGPWSGRAGYQNISDAVTGASWEQGKFLGLDEPVMPLFPNSDSQTGLTGAIAIMHALTRRASEGGSYDVHVSLNQLNNWLIHDVGLHDKPTQETLRALHPSFRPRHDTGFFEMAPMILESMEHSNGSGPGKLFDPHRFTKSLMRWGTSEEATYLDWTRIVSIEQEASGRKIVLEFEHPSCAPGSDTAEWPQNPTQGQGSDCLKV